MVFQVYRNFQQRNGPRNVHSYNNSTGRLSRVLELLLQVVVIALAAAIIGTASHVWREYEKGISNDLLLWLALWPSLVSAQTVKWLIGTASAILFLNILAVILSFVPKLNHKTHPKLSAVSLIALSTLSCLLAISALAVTTSFESNRGDGYTLNSWSCKFGNSIEHFGTLCTESHFAYYAMIPILVVDVFLAVVGVGRLIASKRAFTRAPMTADKSSDY